MRRWLRGLALGAVAALAVTGCSTTPTGTDGDLVDDWATIGAPTAFVPEAGVCHSHAQEVGYRSAYAPVGCDSGHRVETLHVGTLSDAHATGGAPPATDSKAMRAARAECDREARRALGADWRTGRIGMAVVFPSPDAWTGGSRWFRCDVSELRAFDEPGVVLRTASLRGALAGDSPLRHRCFNPKLKAGDITEMVAVSCRKKHTAEFVGVWQAPDTSYAAFRKAGERTHKACLKMVARYAKVPDDGNIRYRAGTIYYHPFEREWSSGNRGVQCFLWLSGKKLTRSVKGAGTGGLPINYR